MTRFSRTSGALAGLLLVVAPPLAAQNDQRPEATRSTQLGIVAGAESTSTYTGALVGAAAGWSWSKWWSAEARAAWLARGTGANAFTADLGATVRVVAPRFATPLVGAGFGLYRAEFTSDAARISDFYRPRLDAGQPLTTTSRAFTDPMFRVTGGVDLRANRRLLIRPEVSALIVRRDGRGETTAVFAVGAHYLFEDRPITPSR